MQPSTLSEHKGIVRAFNNRLDLTHCLACVLRDLPRRLHPAHAHSEYGVVVVPPELQLSWRDVCIAQRLINQVLYLHFFTLSLQPLLHV